MKEAVQGHWTSYFYSGAIALITSWVLALTVSGCRFGNRVESGAPSESPIAFYATQPQKLTVAAVKASGTQSVQASVSAIPSLFSSFFTNPAMLVTLDSKTGRSVILPPTTDLKNARGFPLYVDSTGNIGLSNKSSVFTTWDDPACTMQSSLLIQGKTGSLGDSPEIVDSTLGKIKLKGRIGVTITSVTQFAGNCQASMQSMHDCYANQAQCPQHTDYTADQWQGLAQETFDFYISNGAMTASDIPNIQGLGYEAVYE